MMVVATTTEDPVISELTATLQEWHQIWISLYLDNNIELFERMHDLFVSLFDARDELISLLKQHLLESDNTTGTNVNSQRNLITKSEANGRAQQIAELKADIISKIDQGNQLLGLDLVLRDATFKPVDPIELSPVKLYQLYSELSSNDAAGQHQILESTSATGSTFYSSTSLSGSDITTSSYSGAGHQNKHPNQTSYHMQLSLREHSIALVPQDEKLEIYFSLVEVTNSPTQQLIPISEKFLISIKNDTIDQGQSRTIFTNIGHLKGRELGIVVQTYRIGCMLLAETSRTTTFGKQQSSIYMLEGSSISGSKYNLNGMTRSRHSTIGGTLMAPPSYKRPFGSAFVALTHNSIIKYPPSKEYPISTRIVQVQNEAEFSQWNDIIYHTTKKAQYRANSTQPSIQLDLGVRIFGAKQESIPRVLALSPNEYCITEKRGLPDIVMPGDFKNDLYLTLEAAEFEKGGKSISKNIEASISLMNRKGLEIENSIVPASNCDGISTYRSCIFYHSNSPRWNEHLKISVPLTEFDQPHIRIEFRHCSTKEREKKFLGFCFLPLSDQDGTVIPDKLHELYLYKCDSQIWEDKQPSLCLYLGLPYGPGAERSSLSSSGSLSGSSQTLARGQYQNLSNKFTHSSKEMVTVSTFLLSTKLTQNSTLLNLLRWRELIKRKNNDFEDTLNKVLLLKGEEIMKFLHDILDTLFDTFTLFLTSENGYSSLIFKVLVHIFLQLDDPKYQHFKPVLDTYASAHFSATLVYKGLLACVMACTQRCLECSSIVEWHAPIQKCFRTLGYVFLFIVRSKLLYTQATGDPTIEEHFLMDLRRMFKLFESMLSNVDRKLMGLQETFLESFPSALEQLVRVMDPLELARVATTLAGSVGFHLPPPLSRAKLIFMREVARSSLVRKQAARVHIVEVFCRHFDIYLSNFERLELCHEVLEALLNKIHDSHWPTIRRNYQLMLKNHQALSHEQQLNKSVVTVGEINIYCSKVTLIQANQLDLALGELSHELEPFVKLMNDLLKLLDRLVRDLNSDRPIIQRYCTCLLTTLKLMGKQSFELFLSQRQMSYSNLCDLFKSLRAVYNRDWSVMQLTSHAILEHPIDEISRDDRMEINQNPSSYINLIVDFITHPTLQLESFSERKKRYILDIFGDLRLKFCNQLMRFWNSLSKENYFELIPSSMQSFIDACLLPRDELQQQLLPVFYDMIDAEDSARNNFRQVERHMINNLDLFLNLDRGDAKFVANFDRVIRNKMKEKSPDWELRGSRLVGSFTKLMRLLIDYRQSLESHDNKSKQMICLVELLSFYKGQDRLDIYLKYLFKLCDIHLESEHYTEAGFTLKMYADELRWCQRNLTALEGFRPEEQEWRRKEDLFQRIIQYFELGKCWEESIGLCKELASFYENFLVDYKELSSILKRLTQLLDSILTAHRPEREYFRVEYLGSDMPDYIRGKEFIYRGGEYERLADFMQRIVAEFPEAKVLNSANAKSLESREDCKGQFLIISNVKPVPFLQDAFKTGQRMVNDKVMHYYLNNRLDTFSYDIPILKASSGAQQPIDEQTNNVRNLWVERCMLKVRKQLPDILPWSEVMSRELIEISPVTKAIEHISAKNLELSKLIISHGKDPSKPLTPLTMCLQGVLEASVNGGPAVIMNAFFKRPPPVPMTEGDGCTPGLASSKQQENKVDLDSLLKLKNLIKQQLTLLESGLGLHSKLAPAEVMPLHARLVECLDTLKRTFSDESNQLLEENNYEVLQPVASTLRRDQSTRAQATREPAESDSVSSRTVSSTDEVDGPALARNADLNGNIHSESKQHESEQQQQQSHHQGPSEPAPNSAIARLGASTSSSGQRQQTTRATGAKSELSSPSAARHYTMNSSSLSTLTILSNLPALSLSANAAVAESAASSTTGPVVTLSGCANQRQTNRIALTPTKELVLQQNGSELASKAARRLTFDAGQQRTSLECVAASLPARSATPETGSNGSVGGGNSQTTTTPTGDIVAPRPSDDHDTPPPLPPRLFNHHNQALNQQQQHARVSSLSRSPVVPPRLSSPQAKQQSSQAPAAAANYNQL